MQGEEFYNYEFGEFRLDTRRRSLLKNGEKISLPSKNFDLLLFMIKNSGRILEHDELLDKVWTGTFVEQATLKKGISALRHILQENSETEYIKTIPRRGYSFVLPVRALPEGKEFSLIRGAERQILTGKYKKNDEPADLPLPEKMIEVSPASIKEASSAVTSENNLSRTATLSRATVSKSLILLGGTIIFLVLTFFALKPYFSKTTDSQFSVENVRVTRLTNGGKVLSGAIVSADGTYILYPSAEKEGTSLWLRQVLTGSATRLTPPINGGFWAFAIAPDNSYVYYILNNVSEPQKTGLYKLPLLGGEAQRIAENVGSLAVSPDGTQLALVKSANGETTISIINSKGGDERKVTSFQAGYRLWSIAWTPDGSNLLSSIRKTVDDKLIFYIAEIAPETGQETVIMPDQERVIYNATWLPDKSSMLLTVREPSGDIRQIWQYFPDSRQWRRVTNDTHSYQSVSLTRDGKSIVTSQYSRLAAIWVSDAATPKKNPFEKYPSSIKPENFRQITSGIGYFDQLGWLSDGRLIYSATENGKEMIATMQADGANTRQITNGEDGIWMMPTVAGDGQNICFLSSRMGARKVWRIDADGKNLTQIIEAELPILAARLLRDNSTVIYMAQTKSGVMLFRKTTDGQTTQITHSPTKNWAISPGEKLVAADVMNETTKKYQVELRSIEDGTVAKVFDFSAVRKLGFTPDGSNLVYDAAQSEGSRIMLQPLEGGEPHILTDFQMDTVFSFDWSPDGTRLAVIRGKQLNDVVLIKTDNPQ